MWYATWKKVLPEPLRGQRLRSTQTTGIPSNGDLGECLTLLTVAVGEGVYATRNAASAKTKRERLTWCYLSSLEMRIFASATTSLV